MEDNRGLILTVIGLPASFIFDLVMQVSIISDGYRVPKCITMYDFHDSTDIFGQIF